MWVAWTNKAILDEKGFVTETLSIGNDVTERKRLEEQLRQSQKMEAIGQLAGGIAHDFNNLLTGILGYADVLRAESEPGSSTHEAAKTIEDAAERAAKLTGQLLAFARKGKCQVVPVDMHATIGDVSALLGRTIDRRIHITFDLRAKGATIMGDPNQLQQALLNLAVNARDTIPEGGELSVHTGGADLDEGYCQTHPWAAPGRYLVIAMTDTGRGIPKHVQDRVFEPFFTTKERDSGAGMGLAMVYGIVKNHEGSVQLYSEEGHGTTVKIYLPLAMQPAAGGARAGKEGQPVRGTRRVLVVDDEEAVRRAASSMLRKLGYEVAHVSGGKEAVEYYQEHGDKIDLVILDMVMPDMAGRDVFRALREINPDVKAVLSTGYGRNGRTQATIDEGMVGFVQKPYHLKELSEAVAAALNQ